jgi:RNA polymerase sigma factor (sigma-70 family)
MPESMLPTAEGRTLAAEAIRRGHFLRLVRYVRHTLRPPRMYGNEAEDYAQEALLTLLTYAPRYPVADDGALFSILVRMARNAVRHTQRRCLSQRRAIWRECVIAIDALARVLSGELDPARCAQGHEQALLLARALRHLDARERCLVRARLEGRSRYGELGGRLGITAEAARKAYQRAREKLVRWLGHRS